jgi:hypothetical protein
VNLVEVLKVGPCRDLLQRVERLVFTAQADVGAREREQRVLIGRVLLQGSQRQIARRQELPVPRPDFRHPSQCGHVVRVRRQDGGEAVERGARAPAPRIELGQRHAGVEVRRIDLQRLRKQVEGPGAGARRPRQHLGVGHEDRRVARRRGQGALEQRSRLGAICGGRHQQDGQHRHRVHVVGREFDGAAQGGERLVAAPRLPAAELAELRQPRRVVRLEADQPLQIKQRLLPAPGRLESVGGACERLDLVGLGREHGDIERGRLREPVGGHLLARLDQPRIGLRGRLRVRLIGSADIGPRAEDGHQDDRPRGATACHRALASACEEAVTYSISPCRSATLQNRYLEMAS